MASRRTICILLILIGFLLIALPAAAAEPIARVFSFKGEAYIYPESGDRIIVDRTEIPLNNGDKIVTRDGEVEFSYPDGALTKIYKFSTVTVQEKEEETSFLFFKKSRMVRRVKALIGKIYHQSGSSIKYHIAETPTAVCAIRGSIFTISYSIGKDQKVKLTQLAVSGGASIDSFSTSGGGVLQFVPSASDIATPTQDQQDQDIQTPNDAKTSGSRSQNKVKGKGSTFESEEDTTTGTVTINTEDEDQTLDSNLTSEQVEDLIDQLKDLGQEQTIPGLDELIKTLEKLVSPNT